MKKVKTMRVPKGFKFAATSVGIRKPGRKDMGLIVSDVEATAAGVFTKNRVKASNVVLNAQKILFGKGQAILVNSGNANACTGIAGTQDTREMAEMTAKSLSIRPSRTFVCSTGVIGTRMPMSKIRKGIQSLTGSIGKHSLHDVAEAIMTTDQFVKMASKQITLSGKKISISAIAKGAGMICPDMATMLCFIMTDAIIDKNALKTALKNTVDTTFNTITVDGDTSTSDTVLILANGLAGNKPITFISRGYAAFREVLREICCELAEMIVRDGEGATKVIEVNVKGARTRSDARKAAEVIANSLLVKTAMYGNDANWGRIIAAVGYSGIPFHPDKVDIFFDDLQVVKRSVSTNNDVTANSLLKKKNITISVNVHSGRASARVLTCDLTEDYIRINAGYRT